mmetsp:Transcript_19769/g.39540  ORF Transcript_19769/g.39540 Transcript_19769/m.39540 type:complete len:112 (-) Transcript_19769:44-379(-)
MAVERRMGEGRDRRYERAEPDDSSGEGEEERREGRRRKGRRWGVRSFGCVGVGTEWMEPKPRDGGRGEKEETEDDISKTTRRNDIMIVPSDAEFLNINEGCAYTQVKLCVV